MWGSRVHRERRMGSDPLRHARLYGTGWRGRFWLRIRIIYLLRRGQTGKCGWRDRVPTVH